MTTGDEDTACWDRIEWLRTLTPAEMLSIEHYVMTAWREAAAEKLRVMSVSSVLVGGELHIEVMAQAALPTSTISVEIKTKPEPAE